MSEESFPSWMDKTGYGVIGRFTLDSGEQLLAEIVDFNEVSNEIVVQPISNDALQKGVEVSSRAIPTDQIASFEPEPRTSQPPHTDPCRNSSFSAPRFVLMSALFLSLTVGSLFLFITCMTSEPYRLQELSAISYSMFVIFFTFSGARGQQPYAFTCPAVAPKIRKLIWRHPGFLVALFVLQTAALAARHSLPVWWNEPDAKGREPFELAVLVLCIGLGYAQVFTNRAVLRRAHEDFSEPIR